MTTPRSDKSGRLLVVEDNATLGKSITRALAERFSEHALVTRGDDAVLRLSDPSAEPFDVVVTDMRLPGADGMDVLRTALARNSGCAVLMMTAHGSVDRAVEAMRDGAVDFLTKPFELETLENRVEHLRAARRVQATAEGRVPGARGPATSARIVGESPELLAALDLARRAAPSRSTVLLTGETGTGKELVAELVHANSPRARAPLVKVNCAALPEPLLESELFGHERGAFTSADRLRIGRFEQADGGTLFLDEVGDMSLATQAKLLRVLQDQEFQRLGGTTVLRTDVRIVAATNRNLEEGIAARDFREDLYFRLNVIQISLPPLRERPDDIELLAEQFRGDFAREFVRHCTGYQADAMRRLRAHPWPGNVRELRNVVERAVLMTQGPRIEASELQLTPGRRAIGGPWRADLPTAGLDFESIELAVVEEALERCGWVQKDAAAFLGISRRKLNYMIARMGITHESWRRNRQR